MTTQMVPIPSLSLGFSDAENYKRIENKELFNQLFLRTRTLDRLCEPTTFFLTGEKGTGKTAYAVFLANNDYKNTFASLRYIRETDYQTFVSMKEAHHLSLADYTNIWKVLIYLLLAQQITERTAHFSLGANFTKLRALNRAIDEYYNHAFVPDIMTAIQFTKDTRKFAELIALYGQVGMDHSSSVTFTENRFPMQLMYIQREFEDAFRSLKLTKNHIVFIDGIDIRPSNIPYETYLECVKGLANAVWSLNNDFFATIKDSKGRLRTVLLIRPDIFNSLGLQNQNAKIRDNSAVLDWRTTYSEYRNSDLFMVADRLLSFQQERTTPVGMAWDHYFPWNAPDVRSPHENLSSFISFLRYSLYRPRDILIMLSILKENFVVANRSATLLFSAGDFSKPAFTRKYSDYMLGEVKDQLFFYYSPQEYELLLKFFQYFKGKPEFTYEEFLSAFQQYNTFLERNVKQRPSFSESPDILLQFLYDLNVICYLLEAEGGELFWGWCFRDRSPANIAPKVRTNARYRVHFGLRKALDMGVRFSRDYF